MKSETFTISLEKGAQDSIPFYSPSQLFGFVDEAAHNAQPELNIFELNSGFHVPYWYASEEITKIQQDENGCFLDSDALVQSLWEKDGAVQPPQRFVPLCFKAAVPRAGNYRVKLTLTARAEEEQLLIFHGCRHLAWKGSLRQGAVLSICFTVSVSPIIPNGKDRPFEKNALDIAVVGHCPALDFLSVVPIEVPTVYLAGDSTMADYGAEYPYHPAACYGGWGQALDLYLDGSVEFPIVKDTTPNMMNPRLYTTSYNKPQGQQFDDTAVLSFIKLQYTKKLLLKNNKECLLRNAVGADAEEIHNLFNLTHAQTDFLCTYPDENLFDISQEQKILSEKISSENEIEICAVVNGHIVGTAGMKPVGKKDKVKHRAEFGISIEKSCWGLGIGRALLASCIACAKKAGYSQLELNVVAENERAILMYERAGFVEYGRNPEGFRSRTAGFQEVLSMRLELE